MLPTTVEPAPSASKGYDPTLKALHWTMAVLFIAAVAIGFWCSLLQPGVAPRPALLDIHKSLGVTLFVLVLLRAGWRLSHPAPPLPGNVGPATRLASATVHGPLYALMLAMPVSGYLDSVASNHLFRWFGTFGVPVLVPQNHALSHFGETVHRVGAWAVYVLVTLHVGAALWHAIRRDRIVSRMLP